MLTIILIAASIILLLVLFVPIGVALYQAIKPAPPARPAAPARAAPPPPRPAEPKPVPDIKPPSAELKTERVPALPADASPGVPMKTTAGLEATRSAKPKETPKEGGHAGTEMMEWHGMLRCTAGPLEGQHFIVENEGLYIGRDPSMANIVVNDSRVSKRHLRIVPRNGRVWAIDEGSTNGTFLGSAGERITEHQLKRGDTLVLADGAATFVYQI